MKNDIIQGLARVRMLMAQWDDKLKLSSRFSQNQIDILLATKALEEVYSSQTQRKGIQSGDIKSSAICKSMSQSTYNRALKGLLENGYLLEVPRSNGRYYLNPDKPMTAPADLPEEEVSSFCSFSGQLSR
jgi:hypothetical protein